MNDEAEIPECRKCGGQATFITQDIVSDPEECSAGVRHRHPVPGSVRMWCDEHRQPGLTDGVAREYGYVLGVHEFQPNEFRD